MMACNGERMWWRNFRRAALRVKVPSVALAGNEREMSVASETAGGLVRRLELFDLILLGIGASIGAGIFVVTGTVAADAGPGVVLSFTLAGVASVFNALCYAELATRFPALVGGAYLYSYATFNELTAFLVFTNIMFDYHIGAASITRSLASYLVTLLRFLPAAEYLPGYFGPGGQEFFGGWLSINLLAPILLALLTVILCLGVRESAWANDAMTITKVVIILLVIAVGVFEVDTSNWIPFAPNGLAAIITGATVVFFAYVGFDAVANSAEECKKPQRDLPIAILVSLGACAMLYVAVCLVVTGMVPFDELGGDSPLATAFINKGLTFVSGLIGIGAVAGLTTTVLVGLYVQSRLYLGIGRDGLLPSIFAAVHPVHHTPIAAQIWVGLVAGTLAMFFDVSHLSHILSVGCLSGYSVVSSCVMVLRITPEEQGQATATRGLSKHLTRSQEATGCIIGIAVFGFLAGLFFRFGFNPTFGVASLVMVIFMAVPLYVNQDYRNPPGFVCPWVPTIPSLAIFINMLLFAQLHYEAWIRFGVVTAVAVILYALYGQHYARTTDFSDASSSTVYQKAPSRDI